MMNTVSFMEGKLHDYLSTIEHTTIIDALRPNSTYTIEINNEEITDIYTDANGKFMDILKIVVLRILSEKKPNIDVEQIYKNLKFRLVTSNKMFMHNLNSKNHENIIVTFDCDVIAAENQMTYTTECDLVCPKCFKRTFVKCNFNKKLPTIHCDNFSCKKALLEVDEETAKTDNLQHVLLQEFMEDSISNSPIILEGLITGDLVGSIFVGQKKRITGLYRSVFNTKTNENKILIDIISEKDLDNSCDVLLTDDELNVIKKLIDQDDFLTKICSSFAPQIYGYETLKKSILLQLVGGVGGLKRGDVNVLLVGDPSMAKSELLKFANKITQKSIYTSGKGSSAAGLTIGLVKLDNGKHVAQAGVVTIM